MTCRVPPEGVIENFQRSAAVATWLMPDATASEQVRTDDPDAELCVAYRCTSQRASMIVLFGGSTAYHSQQLLQLAAVQHSADTEYTQGHAQIPADDPNKVAVVADYVPIRALCQIAQTALTDAMNQQNSPHFPMSTAIELDLSPGAGGRFTVTSSLILPAPQTLPDLARYHSTVLIGNRPAIEVWMHANDLQAAQSAEQERRRAGDIATANILLTFIQLQDACQQQYDILAAAGPGANPAAFEQIRQQLPEFAQIHQNVLGF